MKFITILTGLLTLSSSAFAASPFLPISATNTFRSGERAIVEKAITEAETSGKFVLIDMAAAWCGPCLNLEKSEEANKELLAPTLTHFVSVKLEEMFLETFPGTGADFLATEIPWYPSLFIYNPTNGRWSMIYAFDANSLKASLDDYLAHPDLSAFYKNELDQKIASGTSVSGDEIQQALIPFALEQSGDAILNATTGILKAFTDHPDQFDTSADDLESQFSDIYLRALEMGKLSLDQIRQTDPKAFPGLETSARLLNRIYFHIPLGLAVRTLGNTAASGACEGLAQKATEVLNSLPAEDQRSAQLGRDMNCLILKLQLKEKTTSDVAAFEASMTAEERDGSSEELMKLYAATGESFEQALTYGKVWQADMEKAMASRPELLSRVTTATTARLEALSNGKTHP